MLMSIFSNTGRCCCSCWNLEYTTCESWEAKVCPSRGVTLDVCLGSSLLQMNIMHAFKITEKWHCRTEIVIHPA